MNRLPKYWIVKINNREEGAVICKWAEFTWYNDSPINVNFVNYRRIWSITNVENLPEITFEEFTKYILKQDTMINFRIKGTKLPIIPAGNEYRVYNWPDTFPNNTLINSKDHISFGYKEYTGEIYILHEERSYCGSNFYMTKESDIIRLAKEQGLIKQDSMEKEIIGYKCPVDLFNGNIKKDWILFKDSDGNTYRPKGQGPLHALPKEIVETWEPVYKEEYPNITINGYKGEFFDNYVKFGCAEISKEVFIDLFTCKEYPNTNRDVESVTIGKGTFTKEQIKQIAEYYLNKK